MDSHRDSSGRRYAKREPVEYQCTYCPESFLTPWLRHKVPVCDSCLPHHQRVAADRKLEAIKAAYANDPEKYKLRRIELRLGRLGKDLTWYTNRAGRCGICSTTEKPTLGWHIDHDHSCCPDAWWTSCGQCLRGVLCNGCNTGIGQFQDNPETLRRAADWVS